MKELYSAIEEAKADVSGLFMLQYLSTITGCCRPAEAEQQLYTTFLASSFRTLRFGLNEAHGKGMALAVQLSDRQRRVRGVQGRPIRGEFPRRKTAVRDLAHDLLTIEATGDYARAKEAIERRWRFCVPDLRTTLDRLKDIPTDINPSPVTADIWLRLRPVTLE